MFQPRWVFNNKNLILYGIRSDMIKTKEILQGMFAKNALYISEEEYLKRLSPLCCEKTGLD